MEVECAFASRGRLNSPERRCARLKMKLESTFLTKQVIDYCWLQPVEDLHFAGRANR